MEILLIRHGDPDYANDTITQKGHEEAEKLAVWLIKNPPDTVYASPLGRAVDTMRHFTDKAKMDYRVLEWLQEVAAPAVDGVAGWELDGARILSEEKLPGAENWKDEPILGNIFYPFYKKISEGFDNVMALHGYEKDGRTYRVTAEGVCDKRLAFFAHKGAILTLLGYILHWPIQLVFAHCEISTTGVTRLLMKEGADRRAVLKMLAMNERPHLEQQ